MADAIDLREQIAAYLAGDLDAPAAEALEDRMAAEPWVARMADELADVVVDLGGVDAVALPDGFTDRLRGRLADEVGAELPAPSTLAASGAAAATGWADRGPGSGPGRRADARRPGGMSRLQRGLAVAAAVVVVAVAGVGVLTEGGLVDGGGEDETAFSDAGTADAGRVAEDGLDAQSATDGAVEGGAQESAAAESGAALSAPAAEEGAVQEDAALATAGPAAAAASGPARLVLGTADDEALRTQVAQDPAAAALLGTPAADAVELAAAYRDELLRGPALPDGTPAGTCLAAVLADAGPALVPAVVASGERDGAPVIAIALVRAADDQLDTVDVWVASRDTCDVRAVVSG